MRQNEEEAAVSMSTLKSFQLQVSLGKKRRQCNRRALCFLLLASRLSLNSIINESINRVHHVLHVVYLCNAQIYRMFRKTSWCHHGVGWASTKNKVLGWVKQIFLLPKIELLILTWKHVMGSFVTSTKARFPVELECQFSVRHSTATDFKDSHISKSQVNEDRTRQAIAPLITNYVYESF